MLKKKPNRRRPLPLVLCLTLLVNLWTVPVFARADNWYSEYTVNAAEGCFGWAGDGNAPIAQMNGSYFLRGRETHDGETPGRKLSCKIGFHISEITGQQFEWYNNDGYLPCLVTAFDTGELQVKIMNFADKVTIDGKNFEIAYSRVSIKNISSQSISADPGAYGGHAGIQPIPLTNNSLTVAPGATVNHDYAVAADRFGGTYAWPTNEQVKALGGWDQHYDHMKDFWNGMLENIVDIKSLGGGDKRLIDAYKAGYIYTHICRDDLFFHVGENGYDGIYDHDGIGITATLLLMGDAENGFKDYLKSLPATSHYTDGKWKFSWPFALYYMKTGDADFIEENFARISSLSREIGKDRTGPDGIMCQSGNVDAGGYWLVDNYSALMGLTSYRYLCLKMVEAGKDDFNYAAEAAWAKTEHDALLAGCTKRLNTLMSEKGLDYLPAHMLQSNDENRQYNPAEANWMSQFFGRWNWDGFLFGADQSGPMVDCIDATYDYGFGRLNGILPPHTYGGYPGFSTAYNAGYGLPALRGVKYRTEGIYDYIFMIENTMSAPYSWWENILDPDLSSPWKPGLHPTSGGGSSPHMWGQSVATKVLIDSLIAEMANGNVIIGRGLPEQWSVGSEDVVVDNYPIAYNKRMGYKLSAAGNTVTLTLNGDQPSGEVWFNLPAFIDNIASCNVKEAVIDSADGNVKLPAGTRTATVTLKTVPVKCAAPEITTYEGNADGIRLAWKPVAGAKGYVVGFGTTPLVMKYTDVGNLTGINYSECDPGTEYYACVVAYDDFEKGDTAKAPGTASRTTPAGTGGALTIDMTNQAGTNVNLTEEGSLDWLKIGGDADHKLEGGQLIQLTTSVANYAYNDPAARYRWSDGALTAQAEGRNGGIAYNPVYSHERQNVWQIKVPAGTDERTLTIYGRGYRLSAAYEAFLSDGSAPAVVKEFKPSMTGSDIYSTLTITYKANSENQYLYVRGIATDVTVPSNLTLMAATLSSKGTPVIEKPDLIVNRPYTVDGKLVVDGNRVDGKAKDVTIRVTNSADRVEYMRQVKADSTGRFRFYYKPENLQNDSYRILVGGEQIAIPVLVYYPVPSGRAEGAALEESLDDADGASPVTALRVTGLVDGTGTINTAIQSGGAEVFAPKLHVEGQRDWVQFAANKRKPDANVISMGGTPRETIDQPSIYQYHFSDTESTGKRYLFRETGGTVSIPVKAGEEGILSIYLGIWECQVDVTSALTAESVTYTETLNAGDFRYAVAYKAEVDGELKVSFVPKNKTNAAANYCFGGATLVEGTFTPGGPVNTSYTTGTDVKTAHLYSEGTADWMHFPTQTRKLTNGHPIGRVIPQAFNNPEIITQIDYRYYFDETTFSNQRALFYTQSPKIVVPVQQGERGTLGVYASVFGGTVRVTTTLGDFTESKVITNLTGSTDYRYAIDYEASERGNLTVMFERISGGGNICLSAATLVSDTDWLPVSAVNMSSSEETLVVGSSLQLAAEVLPAEATEKTVVWSSSNTRAAIVNDNGLVTARGRGIATITASAGGLEATCVVTVREYAFTDDCTAEIALSADTSGTNRFKAVFKMTADAALSLTPIVAAYDTNGDMLAYAIDNVTLETAVSSEVTLRLQIPVSYTGPVRLEAMLWEKDSIRPLCAVKSWIPVQSINTGTTSVISIRKGMTLQLNPQWSPFAVGSLDIQYSSSNTSVATVSATGKISAAKPGMALIKIMALDGSGVSASILVTVTM